MTNMLPDAWKLITDSWNTFVKQWSVVVKYSVWLVAAAAIQQVGLLVPERQEVLQLCFLVIGGIIGILITIWTSIRLFQVIFALENNQSVTEKTTAAAMTLVLPMVLIGLLQGIATLGGFILLIIPGIYVGIRLGFSQLLLLDQNLRGRAALVASWNMTKNRFWAIFGRHVAAGILFAIVIMVAAGVSLFIVGSIAGMDQMDSGMGGFAFGLINGLIQAALVPLMSIFQIKLYQAVKKAS